MLSQALSIDPLRKCRVCGLEAYTVQDLEMFVKSKIQPYGRIPLCKVCHNSFYRQDGKYWQYKHEANIRCGKTSNPRRIHFLDKQILLKSNPRTNVCSICGRKHPEELKTQTLIHHDFYDFTHPLDGTRELCRSCHSKSHELLKIANLTRWKK
jgi:hypothetical protein